MAFARKGWRTLEGDRKVWQCGERYKVKGVMGCTNRYIDEEMFSRIYILAWNRLLECIERLVSEWEEKMQGNDLLAKFRVMDFIDYISVVTVFLDGIEIECKNEEE